MNTFARVAAVLALMVIAALALCVMAIVAVTMPIDDGREIGRLATAGILRGAA